MRLYWFGLFCLLTLLQNHSIFGQVEINAITEVYQNKNTTPDEVLSLIDNERERFALVLINGKKIDGYLFDKENQMIGTLQTEEKAREYKQILGQTVLKNEDFVVFMANKGRRKFASARFSFEENLITLNELDLDLANESIIQTADYNNMFHLFTITPRSNLINVYRFQDDKTYNRFQINLTGQPFLTKKQKEIDFYDMITVNSGFYGLNKSVDLVRIDTKDPTTLEIASNTTKMYQEKEYFTITFDNNEHITQIAEIDLNTLQGTVIHIEKALKNWPLKQKNSNSFLLGDILFQIVTTRKVLHLRAQNYRTGEIIKEHYASENDTIRFKNTSIIQTGGTFDNYREFEDTATLLRKVNKGKAAIAVQKKGELYQVSYGGIIEKATGAPMMMPGFGIPIAAFGAVTVFINPTYFAYKSYTSSKALTVDALFNVGFEHEDGEISKNIFDRIEDYEYENKISPNGRTVFKMKDDYILGSYEPFTKTYTLRSF